MTLPIEISEVLAGDWEPPFPYFGGKSRIAAEVWQALGGYGLEGGEDGAGRANRHRERLWCSSACLNPEPDRGPLFQE
jgi:hypothetical protein